MPVCFELLTISSSRLKQLSLYRERTIAHARCMERASPVRLTNVLSVLLSHSCLSPHRLITSGRANPVVYTTVYPLEEYAAGLRDLEARKTWGKAVIKIREEDSSAAQAKL